MRRKDARGLFVLFEQAPELEQRGGVQRDFAIEVDADEAKDGVAVVDRIRCLLPRSRSHAGPHTCAGCAPDPSAACLGLDPLDRTARVRRQVPTTA